MLWVEYPKASSPFDLHISPEILNAGGNYSVEGQLVDKITGDPLSSRRITFSSLHITIPDVMTDNTWYL